LPRLHHLHPAVANALDRFALGPRPVHEVVRGSGYSHRHFIAMFRRAVGLPPKTWCRVQRLQRALVLASADPIAPWAELALQAGYSDQAHLSREFNELAGLAPQAYRRSAPASPNHVAIGARLQVNSVQDAMRARG
jgi:transcriptional regulator GlxA family with amidase domain